MAEHKVAIVFTSETYNPISYNSEKVIEKITDWATVSDEQLELLKTYKWSKGFEILETPLDQTKWIEETIQSIIAQAEAEKRIADVEREKRRQRHEQNRVKKETLAREMKLKQLAELQKELGVTT